jgi:hypothetical protein
MAATAIHLGIGATPLIDRFVEKGGDGFLYGVEG